MLMALDLAYTKEMSYSIDEGLHWQACEMTNLTYDVDDIVSDPKMASGVFLIHGSRADKGVIVQIDFADVHENDCVGATTPDTPSSDYETWEPSDTLGSNCLLGRRTKYIRRKRESKCDNPADLSSAVALIKNCSCTEENYQCDYCFTHVGGVCQLDMSNCANYDPKKPPVPCKGTWYETKGYRRVPGDTCDSITGVDHMPILRQCPDAAPQAPSVEPTVPPDANKPSIKVDSNAGGIITFLFLFALVALILVLIWFMSGRNAQLRDFLIKCIPEKFLPDFKVPSAQYAALGEDVDDDAPILSLDNDSDGENKTAEPKDKPEEKQTITVGQDGDTFNPRG